MPEYALNISPSNMFAASKRNDAQFSSMFPTNVHVCHFYKSKADLLELMVPYFVEGLRVGDFCLWGVAGQLDVPNASYELDKALGGGLTTFLSRGQIEIFDVSRLYGTGVFDAMAVKDAFLQKVSESRDQGWLGFRCDGMAADVSPRNWHNYQTYEGEVTRMFPSSTTALCSYDLTKLSGADVVDIVSTHQASLIKKNGSWVVIEPVRK